MESLKDFCNKELRLPFCFVEDPRSDRDLLFVAIENCWEGFLREFLRVCEVLNEKEWVLGVFKAKNDG